jgi:plasmid maintenance system antidote protein VapI
LPQKAPITILVTFFKINPKKWKNMQSKKALKSAKNIKSTKKQDKEDSLL